jgi:hypothetical protein
MMVANAAHAHNPASAARQSFRQAVATVAAKAREALPDVHGRLDAAVKLVLAGDVTLQDDHTALVASRTDPTRTYTVNGHCPCKDAQHRAPDGWCAHRLAAAVAKRASALAATQMQSLDARRTPGQPEATNALQDDSRESRLWAKVAVLGAYAARRP